MPACSSPPTSASTSTGSVTGPASEVRRATAPATTDVLWAIIASSIPVPRPVTCAAGCPVSAAIRQAEGVVLPIPMSPVATASYPASTRSSATSMPTPMASSACSRVMAGPTERSAVPARTFRTHTTSSSWSSEATPMSMTTTLPPDSPASTLTAAPPERKFSTMAAVTSCGHGVTPLATTPWSAAKIATTISSGYGGGQRPWMPARTTETSSRMPREPAGLVRLRLPSPGRLHRRGVERAGSSRWWWSAGPRRSSQSHCVEAGASSRQRLVGDHVAD